MKTAIVESGLFEVNDIGEVYRISDGKRNWPYRLKRDATEGIGLYLP